MAEDSSEEITEPEPNDPEPGMVNDNEEPGDGASNSLDVEEQSQDEKRGNLLQKFLKKLNKK